MLLVLFFAFLISNTLEGSALTLESASDLNDSTTQNNSELCSILSICNNLAALSSELAAVRAEQTRQAELLDESCQAETVSIPANCYEALKDSQKSGVIDIRVPEYSKNPFKVACDQSWRHGGGWTVILRRTDGSVDFLRKWKDYEEGFGQVDNEYFVGLGRLHALTSSVRQELLVIIEDFLGERYQVYDDFRVGGEASNYTLESLGSYSGTAGEALKYHLGMQFSTIDRDNDGSYLWNCAKDVKGGWWYKECFTSNLAGPYENFNWNTDSRQATLITGIMMIRPRISTLNN